MSKNYPCETSCVSSVGSYQSRCGKGVRFVFDSEVDAIYSIITTLDQDNQANYTLVAKDGVLFRNFFFFVTLNFYPQAAGTHSAQAMASALILIVCVIYHGDLRTVLCPIVTPLPCRSDPPPQSHLGCEAVYFPKRQPVVYC